MSDHNERLLTVNEVAEYLRVPKSGIYDLVFRKKIPFIKLGNRLRFKKVDIDNWIESQIFNPIKDDDKERF